MRIVDGIRACRDTEQNIRYVLWASWASPRYHIERGATYATPLCDGPTEEGHYFDHVGLAAVSPSLSRIAIIFQLNLSAHSVLLLLSALFVASKNARTLSFRRKNVMP